MNLNIITSKIMKGKSLWAILALATVSSAEKVDIEPYRYGVTKEQEREIAKKCHTIDRLEGRYVAE